MNNRITGLHPKFRHFASFQGSEIRKFVRHELKQIVDSSKIDIKNLKATIEAAEEIIATNANGIELYKAVIESNKKDIEKNTRKLNDFLANELSKLIETNANEIHDLKFKLDAVVSTAISEIDRKIKDVKEEQSELIIKLKKELLFQQDIDVNELCSDFSKSLWDYDNHISVGTTIIGKGKNKVFIKASGDHFNPFSPAGDFGQTGSPRMIVSINDEVVSDGLIKAIKILNQYETFIFNTDLEVKTVSVRFVRDAWEGGKDKNMDGVKEDRNLWIFEATLNEQPFNKDWVTYGKRKFQEGMFWQGEMVFNTVEPKDPNNTIDGL